MTKWTRLLSILLAMAVLAGVGVASAQDDKNAAAQEKFNEGKSLYKQQKFAQAATAFREANSLSPSWKLLFNIGQSEAAAKRHGLALQTFEKYLSQGGDDIPEERLGYVLKEVEYLRKMVGQVEIDAPRGATIFVDSVERGIAPLPGRLPVAASVIHTIRMELGDVKSEKKVEVMGGDVVSVEFNQVQSTGQTTAEPIKKDEPAVTLSENETRQEPKESPPGNAKKTWGWITVGLGGALMGVGAATGGVALSMNNELKQDCYPSCTSARQDDVNKRDNFALTTNILLGTGAASFVVGILLLTVFKDKHSEEAPVSLVPIVGPNNTGGAIEWRF